jgi:RNA polymerase sigma factor (sigma-70 family)
MPPPPADNFAARIFLGPALRTQPDRRLVTLVREGYETAFDEIVRRYARPLDRFAAAIVGGRSEDVTQDAFSKALLALRGSETDIELRPWLYRIVRNTALNDLRDSPPTTAELAETLPGGQSAAVEVERREEAGELMGRLRALPEAQRAAIVMRELEGLSHDEIAAALGISGGAARQAIYRARVTLRNGLGMLVPLPLLRALFDHGSEAAAGAGGAVAAAGTAAGTGAGGSTGATLGGLGAGGALKAGLATALIAGSVGAGVAIEHRGGRAGAPEADQASAAELPGQAQRGAAALSVDGSGGPTSRRDEGDGRRGEDGSGKGRHGDGGGDGASGDSRGQGGDSSGPGGGGSGSGTGSGHSGENSSGHGGPGPSRGGSSGGDDHSGSGEDSGGHHSSGGSGSDDNSGSGGGSGSGSGSDDGSGSGGPSGGGDSHSGPGGGDSSGSGSGDAPSVTPLPPPDEPLPDSSLAEDGSSDHSGSSGSGSSGSGEIDP